MISPRWWQGPTVQWGESRGLKLPGPRSPNSDGTSPKLRVSEGENSLHTASVLLSTLHAFSQGLGLDLRMQIKPMMGERGTPVTPGDWSALQESPWSSEDTVSLGSGLLGGPQPQPGKPRVQEFC